MWAFAFAVGCVMLMAAPRASAQEATEPDTGRFRFGPLRFTPSIAISNAGIDTNVYNDSADPRRDATATLQPAVDLWMRPGGSRLNAHVEAQYLYYNQLDNERSWGSVNRLRWEFPLGHIAPFLIGNYSNTKQRGGYEIDARVRALDSGAGIGTAIHFSGKTTLTLSGTRSDTIYEDSAQFDGFNLATELNHRTNSEELELRYALTSLTTFVAVGTAIQDRFGRDVLRSSNSTRVLAGFDLNPDALIAGTVRLGYRRFRPLDSRLRPFKGFAGSADVKFTNYSRQLGFQMSRDVTYSYDQADPYFVLTNLGATVIQRITYAWDVVGGYAWQRLHYQPFDPTVARDGRIDHGRQLRGGVGYRIGRTVRIGVDVMYDTRRSQIAARSYSGLRFGGSLTYGLQRESLISGLQQ